MTYLKTEVLTAESRIRPYLKETPLLYSYVYSKMFGASVYLKLENLQPVGAFKVRGALNKLLSLNSEEKKQGIVAASTGNHGAGVAFSSQLLGIKNTIFVPENASPLKIDNIKNYDADLRFHGTDVGETEHFAREYAQKNNLVYVSPYNDLQIVAGQGTIGFELHHQLKNIDAVFVPIGGGGLISGIAGYLKAVNDSVKIIGCLPKNSPVMAACVKAGEIIHVDTQHTISDATKGNLEENSITFDFCKQWVDDYQLVSEAEIISAMQLFLKKQHLLIEGAVGVALSAFEQCHHAFKNKNVVIIVSGANISFDALKTVINSH
jgi:threonine dehydratase